MTQTVNLITTRSDHFVMKTEIVDVLQEKKAFLLHQSTNENRKQTRFVDAAPSLQTCILTERKTKKEHISALTLVKNRKTQQKNKMNKK